MKVFVDTPFGSTLTFDLSCTNKLSDIKRRIENSHGIPVSMQTLHFNGVELLVDHHQLSTYRIVNNSRLVLLFRDAQVNNQMHHQSPYAVQGFVPSMARSIYGQVPPSHASASFFNQDLSMVPRSNEDQDASEAFYNQERLVSNDGQVLHETYESVLETFSMDEFLERDTEPWTAQDIRKMEGFWPGTSGDNVNVQEPSGRNSKNQDLLQETTRTNINQVFQTEHSLGQSNSTGESSSSQLFQTEKCPPPQKLKLIITKYDKRGTQFLVEVNESDNVEELRKELEKIQDKTQLDLPAKGYVFMHKQNVLVDCKSFYWNRVAHGDTIEIFPGAVTKGYHT